MVSRWFPRCENPPSAEPKLSEELLPLAKSVVGDSWKASLRVDGPGEKRKRVQSPEQIP